MKQAVLIICILAATFTLGGCASSVEVPQSMNTRLDRDMLRPVDDLNREELRVHYNDLNNYVTLMEVGRGKTEGLERNDYEQYLRIAKPRLEKVEAALLYSSR